MAKTVTVKNMSDRLHRWLKKRAATHHRSLNGEILHILQGLADAGAAEKSGDLLGGAGVVSDQVHRDLDAFAGTWSDEEAAAFEKVIADLRTIDEDMWK